MAKVELAVATTFLRACSQVQDILRRAHGVSGPVYCARSKVEPSAPPLYGWFVRFAPAR